MFDKKEDIVLVGMPASGKSTVGVILAKMRGMSFVDTDLVLQKAEGCRLRDIIEKQGIDAFLRKEGQTVNLIRERNAVIATGGSMVYSSDAMRRLAERGVIVYLKVEFGELRKRLTDIRGRGVVLREGETLEEMFAERSALYERYSDITVTETGTIEDTVRAVMEALGDS